MSAAILVLGSRSPRRCELLSSIVPPERMIVLPPLTPEELCFDDVTTDAAIENRLRSIVLRKHADVTARLQTEPEWAGLRPAGHGYSVADDHVVLVADTIVVAATTADQRIVLGQPPAANWQYEVRRWLSMLLSGRTHSVLTCFRVTRGSHSVERIVQTGVTFHELSDAIIEWYLAAAESPGKAGGYAIQGRGAALVCGLHGSLTNVIGLPLIEVADSLRQLAFWDTPEA